jgi:heat shock protein HslJ
MYMKNFGMIGLLFALACQSQGNSNSGREADSNTSASAAIITPDAPDTTTLGGRWYLQPVLPSDTATGKIPWLDLNLALSSFSGNTGCNSMHGKFYFSKADNSLAFSDKIAISKMACPGFNELAFLKSLRNTARFKLRRDTLIFTGDDHSELSRWIRAIHR